MLLTFTRESERVNRDQVATSCLLSRVKAGSSLCVKARLSGPSLERDADTRCLSRHMPITFTREIRAGLQDCGRLVTTFTRESQTRYDGVVEGAAETRSRFHA